MSPPNSLITFNQSWGTDEEPCITKWVSGIRLWIALIRSIAKMSPVGGRVNLYAPWLVAEEIYKVLKLNGYVCIETVFCYQAHERPFNFFNCSDLGLKVLFNNELGFEAVDSGLDLPLRARFSIKNPKYLRMKELYSAMSHSYFVGQKINKIDLTKYKWKRANPTIHNKEDVYPNRLDNKKIRENIK